MPSTLTSSFASAAAGGTGDNNANKREGSTGNEWSRTRMNGSQTFRRPSTQSRDNSQLSSNSSASAYIPPHLNQQPPSVRNGVTGDFRYGKGELLAMYQSQRDTGVFEQNLDRFFTGPFDSIALQNGMGLKPDSKEMPPGPEVCWNAQSEGLPLSLMEMTDSEKQLFSSSVNSPLKMNSSKEGGSTTTTGRKTSMSNPYSGNSTNTSRPGTRRRETGESISGNALLSPTENKTFFRNEPAANTPPPALLRRRTDMKDEEVQEEIKEDIPRQENDLQSPFASLRRTGTSGSSTAINGPSSPWSTGTQASAFGSIGSFGNFGSNPPGGAESSDKRPGFGSARGSSRLKDFLAKSTTEDPTQSVKEKTSFGALGKLPEEEESKLIKTRPNRSETNPYEDNMPRSGSAALSHDEQTVEQMGFSAYGGQSGTQFGQSDPRIHQTPYSRIAQDAMSPTSTNPYQSPQGARTEEDDDQDPQLPQSGLQPFGGSRRDVFSGSDNRSQGAFGSTRGLGGLGSLSSWPQGGLAPPPSGRDRPAVSSAFGDSVFSSISDLQTPGGTAFAPNNFFGNNAAPGSFSTGNRPSRLGGLFPPAMQDQMRSDSRNDAFEVRGDSAQGRDPFDSSNRRSDGFRGFEEVSKNDAFSPQNLPASSNTPLSAPGSGQRTSAGPESSSQTGDSGQMPAAQQRQMVMPDRMRWVYRDPHGNVQGPWSGLEMHDWFKAGFFTAELQVKKLEDGEYEPLAQLVRRIGNSREPFLVPQIGVPHGAPPHGQSNPWSAGQSTAGPAQPPFASSFPSFGTTLTADQQNALERRKQEEQYLMARQKEFLAQRQMYMNQPQIHSSGHGAQPLNHQQSANSLHSQPSFGSITSPSGYQPSPMQGPIQPPPQSGSFGTGAPGSAVPSSAREEEVSGQFGRMSFNERLNAQGLPHQSMSGTYQERDTIPRDMLPAELQAHQNAFLGQQGRNERLEEFHELRGSLDLEEDQIGDELSMTDARLALEDHSGTAKPAPIGYPAKVKASSIESEPLSLTQQVQRTAAANKQAASETSIIEPPPLSISPLPAPAAQRNRQHVADALAAESRSATQTPLEATSASVAPWAEKSAEMPKVSSLKEIQEAEAKRAAEQEELLIAARRAQAEQDRLTAAQVVIPAPGLPSTSNWASSTSPGTPTTPGANVWAKQNVVKPPSGTSGTTPKKTLAQIQKEEEARKLKVAAQAAAQTQTATVSTNTTGPSGNRYAQIASKVAQPQTQQASGAWTTVGSSGKPKTPATVVAAPQAAQRTPSSGNVTTTAATRPGLPASRSASMASGTKDKARDELVKWAKSQMGKGLNSGINVEDFVRNLLDFPSDVEVLSEAIYGSSQTLDGRRLAEEFIRRRKLAERGIVDSNGVPSTLETKSTSGGWSEVAKKGPVKEDSNAASGFKVVSKKKGKR